VTSIVNLPVQTTVTAFTGREEELTKISLRLKNPNCRLLTLLGTGGVGKTRLAIQVATSLQDYFSDGIYFVDLQSVNSTSFLASAIIDSLKTSGHGELDPPAKLLEYLQDKQMLVILDNFEHLLDETKLVEQLLTQTSDVKLVITSREILNLTAEWVLPIAGLAFPETENLAQQDNFAAVQLFIALAKKIKPDFSSEDELPNIVRICQLVEGLPLALELASTWLRLLSCEKIVTELQTSLDFMESNLRDIPARHRSMRTVFNESWQFLSEQEQTALKRLAIFRGGFTRFAAQKVAGASLNVLRSLTEKSLLQKRDEGRYYLHELLRQYAWEQLDETSGQVYDLYENL
jgi:predicted ATPase